MIRFIRKLTVVTMIMALIWSNCVYAQAQTLRVPTGEHGRMLKLFNQATGLEDRLVSFGGVISEAIYQNRGKIDRPVNIVFVGEPGSLKTTFANTIKEILGELDISAEVIITDMLPAWEDSSFKALDEKHKDKDVIIAEVVTGFKRPNDIERLDLYIRFTGGLYVRQQRITDGSDSYYYAQERTMAVTVQDYRDRKADLLINTDDITIPYIQEGRLKEMLKKGIEKVQKIYTVEQPPLPQPNKFINTKI